MIDKITTFGIGMIYKKIEKDLAENIEIEDNLILETDDNKKDNDLNESLPF